MIGQLKRRVRSARRRRGLTCFAAQIEPLEDRQLLSGSPVPTALTPAQISAYYGFNQINFTLKVSLPGGKSGTITIPGNGTGETIAIIDKWYDPNIQNDANVFDEEYNLPPVNLTVHTMPGITVTTTEPSGAWEAEEASDVEWAHAMAPQANILVVNCGTSLTDVLNAVNYAKNAPGVSVVSMSLSGGEPSSELTDDSYFSDPTNHGGIDVSFVAASGDNKGAAVAQWPATSPNVLGVGGTVLSQSEDGSYTEQSWASSQGGPSMLESEPLYQYSVQRSGMRETPDVSYDAANYSYYNSFPLLNTKTGESPVPDWAVVGGTSLGTPQWAALIAIANQGRQLAGVSTLGTYVPAAIYAMPAGDFNDITTGPANPEGFAPGPGYDQITGRGTPRANLLVPDLVNYEPRPIIPPFPFPIHFADFSIGPNPTPPPLVGPTTFANGLIALLDSGMLRSNPGSTALSAAPVDARVSTLGDRSPEQATFVDATSSVDGSGADPSSVQWAGLNSALSTLNLP